VSGLGASGGRELSTRRWSLQQWHLKLVRLAAGVVRQAVSAALEFLRRLVLGGTRPPPGGLEVVAPGGTCPPPGDFAAATLS